MIWGVWLGCHAHFITVTLINNPILIEAWKFICVGDNMKKIQLFDQTHELFTFRRLFWLILTSVTLSILFDFGCPTRLPCILHHCHTHTWGDACNSYTGHCHQLLFLDILRCWVGENMPFVCLITCFCFSNIVSYLSKKIILFFSFSSGIYIFLLSDQSLEAWDYPFN